jgi:endonuclease G
MPTFENDLVDGPWSLQRGLNLGLLAEAAYAEFEDLPFILSDEMDLELVDHMPTGASQGFVAVGEQVVVLAFAGTNQLTDWLVNLRFLPVDASWGRTHRGFKDAYDDVSEQCRAAAARARDEGKTFWITGHSLGGALAHIAGHDLFRDGDRTGLVTFGQPRTLRIEANDLLLQQRMPLGYHRIVNGRDIVTRVPPNLPHTGELVRIGRRGWFGLESNEAEAEEMPALTEAEFEAFQERLRGIESQASQTARGPAAMEAIDRSVEGLIPGIKDHRITSYVSELRTLVPSADPDDDLDPFFSSMPANRSRRGSGRNVTGGVFGGPQESSDLQESFFLPDRPLSTSANARNFGLESSGGLQEEQEAEEEMVPVLIRLIDQSWEPAESVQVLSRDGAFVTAMIKPSEISDVEADKSRVKSVEVSRPGGFLELADSMPFVKGQPVDRPGVEEAGQNALVGVIDTGIDVLHNAFTDEDGKTRIVAIWDQFDKAGPTPREVDASFEFDFGTLYTAQDINDMRDGNRDVPVWMRDPQGHGTHVSGIAAGRATGSMENGMAPDATIAVVIPAMEATRQDPNSLGYSVSHISALHFLRKLAVTENSISQDTTPIAINVSLGMNAGAHDGKTPLEAAFDSITSQGTEPGVVIVKSAGNERRHRGHCHVDVAQGRVDVDWTSLDVGRQLDYLEGWYARSDRLAFVLRSPDGGETDEVSRQNRETDQVIDGNLVRMRVRPFHRDNGDNALYISIQPDAKPILKGHWKLEVRGQHVSARTTGLHIWAERTGDRAIQFFNASEKHTLSVPGTAEEIITVGATDLRDPYPGVIDQSSFGPTRGNAAKPEISAPGLGIVSAFSNQDDLSATRPDTGTSMAAPHVAGAVALALSRRVALDRSQFNTQQIRSLLQETAQYRSGVHNNGFGFGILDVAEFLSFCDDEP